MFRNINMLSGKLRVGKGTELSASKNPFWLGFVLYIIFLSPFVSVHTICNLNNHPFLLPILVCSKSFGFISEDHSYWWNQHKHIILFLTLSARSL